MQNFRTIGQTFSEIKVTQSLLKVGTMLCLQSPRARFCIFPSSNIFLPDLLYFVQLYYILSSSIIANPKAWQKSKPKPGRLVLYSL
jgi:hypothetical protein